MKKSNSNKLIAKFYSAIGKEWMSNLSFPITSLCLRTDSVENFANIENQENFLSLNMENFLFSMPFKTRSFEGNRKCSR